MDRAAKDRAAKNEALFRDVNERVKKIAEDHDVATAARWDFLCECARTDCLARFSMTEDEYERLRSNPTHFAVVPGHEQPEIERVIASCDDYLVVEKLPGEHHVAVATDPRS